MSIFFIAVGLAMDALAVAVASGLTTKRFRIYHAFRMAFFFGLFQGVMPVLGWAACLGCHHYIEHIAHWIAFGLLTAVGVKMIYEAFIIGRETDRPGGKNLLTLIVLSFATSIDAFAIGITLSMLSVSIIHPAVIIGLVTFCVSLAGFFIGTGLDYIVFKCGQAFCRIVRRAEPECSSSVPGRPLLARHIFEKTAELAGGVILVGIGIRILLQHFL